MTDKFKGWYPDYIENEKEREPILKLAKMMTGRAMVRLRMCNIEVLSRSSI